jgi:hydrogenase expression/formation protein HypC
MCLAIPGKIMSIEGTDELRSARVNFGGIVKEVSLGYLPDAVVDDYVLVHVGFALSKIDEEEAKQVFEFLKTMGELAEIESEEPQ